PEPPPAPPAPATYEIHNYAAMTGRPAVEAMLDRALADVDRCRTDRALRLAVLVAISGGAVQIARHDPSRRSDDTHVADCVGEVVRRHGTAIPGGPTGAAIYLWVDLPPR
ncbi:MAG: hypothetical protein R3B82_23110, partial [Sandaracinaceae bacterium]